MVLFNGFAIQLNKRNLEVYEKMSETSLKMTLENTITDVTKAYYSVKLENEKLKVVETLMNLSKDRYKYIQLLWLWQEWGRVPLGRRNPGSRLCRVGRVPRPASLSRGQRGGRVPAGLSGRRWRRDLGDRAIDLAREFLHPSPDGPGRANHSRFDLPHGDRPGSLRGDG